MAYSHIDHLKFFTKTIKMKKLLSILSFAILFTFSMSGQRTVTGTVADSSGDPLIGVNILAVGTVTGTITDIDGAFSLEVPSEVTELLISYTGYAEQKVTIGESNTLVVTMTQGQLMDEIVISGQGSGISKRRLSTTVDDLSGDEIDKLPSNQLDQILQANAPSAQVRMSSGQPGTTAIIRTRGPISASSSATPMIIIDGIRVDNLNSNPSLAGGTGGAAISALADIPVESIEKMEYIKGGAATTLYGADAANGVIQIITKKGRPGKITPFIEFRLGSINAQDQWLKYERTGEAIFEPGVMKEYKAGVSGGTSKFSYNFSGSLYEDDGFNDLNEQLKRSFAFGFNSSLSDNLTYRGSFSYTGFNYNLDYNANTSFSRFSAAEGGAYGNLDELTEEEWQDRKESIATQGALSNITQRVNRLVGSNTLSYRIGDLLTTNLTFGVENRNSRQALLESNAFQIHVGALPPGTTDLAELYRSLRNSFTTTVNWDVSNETTVNDLSFITTVGARFFRTNDYQEALDATGGVDGTSSVNNFAEKSASDFALENANYGVYFLENVGWKNTVFLELGGTLDKNTSAGDDTGFAFLPKIGISANLSDYLSSNILSNIRVRANYGEATNFAQPFSQDRTFALESFLGQPAFRFANPGNKDLISERVKTTEAGVDFNLFDYRLNLGATYYNAKTEDALFTPRGIPSGGQLAQITNIGEILNKGWELYMDATLLSAGKHSLSINGSYNYNDNLVSDAGGSPPFVVGGFSVIGSWIEEGESLGFLRGTAAVLQDDGSYEFVQNSFLGKSYAPHFGSAGIKYEYDKFSFFASSDYQFGGTNVDLSLLLRYLRGVELDNVPEELQSQPFFNVVNLFTDSSDFWKIRNIGAAYDFGSMMEERVSNIRLAVNLTNPFAWTKAGFDPEVTGSGISAQNGFASGGFAYGTESAPKMVVGSIKISF